MNSVRDFILKVERETSRLGDALGNKCVKYIFVSFNAFYIMVSLIMIFGGVYGHLTHIYGLIYETHLISIPWTVNGTILCCLAIFGMIGAFKENIILANIYGVLMMIAVILQIAAAIAAFSFIGSADHLAKTFIGEMMKSYNSDDHISRKRLDWIQNTLQCCGNDGPSDWLYHWMYRTVVYCCLGDELDSDYTTTTAPLIYRTPSSCCFNGSDYQDLTCDNYFQTGCSIQLRKIVLESILFVGSSALAIALVQIIGIVGAITLTGLIRRAKSYTHVQKCDHKRE